jgi:hypothetical protein
VSANLIQDGTVQARKKIGLFASKKKQRKRAIALIKLGFAYVRYKNQIKITRRWWVQPENLKRQALGGFNSLLEIYKKNHPEFYKDTLRISPDQFDHLHSILKSDLTKETTNMREPIGSAQRLSLTLLFLASGDSIKLLALFFR